MTRAVVKVEQRDSVAIVQIDNPPVNATSVAVRTGLMEAVSQVNKLSNDVAITHAVLICAGRTFCAGGDITEFSRPAELPDLPDVVQAIEDSEIPFIAAMHGSVFGGGLEIAMGCAWRIAAADTRFGLPEVNVGLIPGAGGSQRLPRLVGVELALDMCTSGKPVNAASMLDAGGIDEIITDQDLLTAAIEFSAAAGARPEKIRFRSVAFPAQTALDEKRLQLEKKSRGQQAALCNFDAVMWVAEPFELGQPKERAQHLQMRQSDESIALRHAFLAERSVSKPAIIKDATARSITNIAIVGGGLMGSGIATSLLSSGFNVVVVEQKAEAANAARQRVLSNLQGALKRGKITQSQLDQFDQNLQTGADMQTVSKADLLIEAVFEDLQVKQALFDQVVQLVRDDTILATNTSYLDPQLIFKNITDKSRCVGLHFFSPAHIMRLLEIVHLPQTSKDVIATAFKLAKTAGKVGVLSGICDGFIGNRILAAYRREAEYLLADGALPQQIDDAMRAFGYAMGPFEVQDLSGLQIAWANRQAQQHKRDPAQRYISIADELCELERFGQRSGRGWYNYPDGPQSKTPDPIVEDLIIAWSASNNIERRRFSESEIVERLAAVLVNEGACIVEEGIADDAAAVDMVLLHGYGFPRWRGGPMQYSESIGADTIAAALAKVTDASPGSWAIANIYQR